MKNKIILLMLFLLFLSKMLLAQNSNNNDTVRLVLWLNSSSKYQVLINNYCYEFSYSNPNSTGHPVGVVYGVFQKSINIDQYTVKIRAKKKYSLRWEYCKVNIKNDTNKKYILLYRDYRFKEACFEVKYINEAYPKGSEKIFDENDKEFEKRFLPTRIFYLKRGWKKMYR